MITVKNYFKDIEAIKVDELPETLKKSHEFLIKATNDGKDWKTYEQNEKIRKVIDLYLEKLNNHLQSISSTKKVSPPESSKQMVIDQKVTNQKQAKAHTSVFQKAFALLKTFVPGLGSEMKGNAEVKLQIKSGQEVSFKFSDKSKNRIGLLVYDSDDELLQFDVDIFFDTKEAHVTAYTMNDDNELEYGLDKKARKEERDGGDIGEPLTKSMISYLKDVLRLEYKTHEINEAKESPKKTATKEQSPYKLAFALLNQLVTGINSKMPVGTKYAKLKFENRDISFQFETTLHSHLLFYNETVKVDDEDDIEIEIGAQIHFDKEEILVTLHVQDGLEKSYYDESLNAKERESLGELLTSTLVKVMQELVDKGYHVKLEQNEPKKIEHISEEIKYIKRFVGLHNKIKSPNAILAFIKALQRSIVQRLIRKTSPFAKEIEMIQDKLINGYNKMKGKDKTFEVNENDLSRLVGIAGGELVYPSINIIKRYVGMQGKKVDQGKIALFEKQIENSIGKKKVSHDDPYYDKVKAIHNTIKKLKAGQVVNIAKAELNGLEGIVKACGCKTSMGRIYDTGGKELRPCKRRTYSDSKSKGACSHNQGLNGVMTAEEMGNRQFDRLNFASPWDALMGKPAKNFTIMFHGEPGSGKTTLLLKFAEYLAINFGRVIYISSEEHEASTLTDKINELLKPKPAHLVFAPNLEFVDLEDYDFIILDSVNDLALKLDAFKKLRKDNPHAAFILILQHTKDGGYRGGKDWEHDIQIAAKVEEGVATVYRSRYGVKGSLNFFQYFNTKPIQSALKPYAINSDPMTSKNNHY